MDVEIFAMQFALGSYLDGGQTASINMIYLQVLTQTVVRAPVSLSFKRKGFICWLCFGAGMDSIYHTGGGGWGSRHYCTLRQQTTTSLLLMNVLVKERIWCQNIV